MNNAAKERNRQILAEDIRQKRAIFRANPEIVVVEPTNRCNLSCALCARTLWNDEKNPPMDMDEKTLRLLEPFFETAGSVFAFGHGEPTLGKNFEAICRRAKAFGCELQITTNGTGLDDALIDLLVEIRADIVIVSLDAIEGKASESRRGVDPAEMLDRLQRVRVEKVAAGQKTPETGVGFVADRYNLGEIPNLIEGLAAVGASILTINHYVAWEPKLHPNSAYHVEAEFREAFTKAKALGERKGVAVILPFDNMGDGPCPHPFSMFVVRASGEVWPCCNAVFRQDRYSFPAGNVHLQSLREIWNGEVYQALRRGWFLQDAPSHCKQCPLAVDELESHLRVL